MQVILNHAKVVTNDTPRQPEIIHGGSQEESRSFNRLLCDSQHFVRLNAVQQGTMAWKNIGKKR